MPATPGAARVVGTAPDLGAAGHDSGFGSGLIPSPRRPVEGGRIDKHTGDQSADAVVGVLEVTRSTVPHKLHEIL